MVFYRNMERLIYNSHHGFQGCLHFISRCDQVFRESFGAAFARPGRQLGRRSPGQPEVCRRGILDFSHGCALARPASRLRWVEQHAPALHPLANKAIWEKLLEQLVDEPDFEWLMIDAATSRSIPMPPEPGAAIRPCR
jgi:hypothetical protein